MQTKGQRRRRHLHLDNQESSRKMPSSSRNRSPGSRDGSHRTNESCQTHGKIRCGVCRHKVKHEVLGPLREQRQIDRNLGCGPMRQSAVEWFSGYMGSGSEHHRRMSNLQYAPSGHTSDTQSHHSTQLSGQGGGGYGGGGGGYGGGGEGGFGQGGPGGPAFASPPLPPLLPLAYPIGSNQGSNAGSYVPSFAMHQGSNQSYHSPAPSVGGGFAVPSSVPFVPVFGTNQGDSQGYHSNQPLGGGYQASVAGSGQGSQVSGMQGGGNQNYHSPQPSIASGAPGPSTYQHSQGFQVQQQPVTLSQASGSQHHSGGGSSHQGSSHHGSSHYGSDSRSPRRHRDRAEGQRSRKGKEKARKSGH